MKIRCTRNTGFYGMGSPIEVRKDEKKWFYLSQNQTKEVTIEASTCVIQATFFLLKSKPITVIDNGQLITLEITMNPTLVLIYVILFAGMFLIPLLRLSILGVFILLILYVVFLFSMLNKAYVIKETS